MGASCGGVGWGGVGAAFNLSRVFLNSSFIFGLNGGYKVTHEADIQGLVLAPGGDMDHDWAIGIPAGQAWPLALRAKAYVPVVEFRSYGVVEEIQVQTEPQGKKVALG